MRKFALSDTSFSPRKLLLLFFAFLHVLPASAFVAKMQFAIIVLILPFLSATERNPAAVSVFDRLPRVQPIEF